MADLEPALSALRTSHIAVEVAVIDLENAGNELINLIPLSNVNGNPDQSITQDTLASFNSSSGRVFGAVLQFIESTYACSMVPWAVLSEEITRLEPKREYRMMQHPGTPRGDTALARVACGYGFACALDRRARDENLANRFFLRQVLELWQKFAYEGGTHASGGLATAQAQK